MVLTRTQRDFLDHYFVEYMELEPGPTIRLGAQHDFFYEHLRALFEIYRQAWGDEWGTWTDSYPPLSNPSDRLVFPWSSISDLEDQLKADGIEVIPIPRTKAKGCPSK
jgi:hypothetical protein